MNASLVSELEGLLQKSLGHLTAELSKLQIGRASVGLVDTLQIEVYGSRQPLKALATISTPDARTIQIQPWDKSILQQIDAAIQQAGLGLNPRSDGSHLYLNIPQPTEERRTELKKIVKRKGEEAKIAIRNDRHAVMEKLKGMKQNNAVSEDEFHQLEKQLQEVVEKSNTLVDEMVKGKEKDIAMV